MDPEELWMRGKIGVSDDGGEILREHMRMTKRIICLIEI